MVSCFSIFSIVCYSITVSINYDNEDLLNFLRNEYFSQFRLIHLTDKNRLDVVCQRL